LIPRAGSIRDSVVKIARSVIWCGNMVWSDQYRVMMILGF
jgi:hypothetical protein